MTTRISKLTQLGQSLWYDNMERRLLENGELAAMIQRGDIRGLTSNPSIFNNAIAKSKDYDSALIPMAWAGLSDKEILEQLMIEDIRATADLLRSLYDETHAGDGYVSLEVRPELAYDTKKTITEAKRLWKLVDRPNVMIKIPGTKAGLPAIRQSLAAGININITLIFSISRYKEVMEAYLSGLEDRLKAGQPIDQIHSVASFFVSRIDSKVDKYLETYIQTQGSEVTKAKSLLGKLAIANARLAYQEFLKVFESERFKKLKAKGARIQRPLWASTSTKNPAYPDTMYVDELIGANTINTVPQQTLDAFRDHGKAKLTLEHGIEEAQRDFSELETLGISMEQVTQELETEGVQAFSAAYASLQATIAKRSKDTVAELGPIAKLIPDRLAKLQADNVPARFHAFDPTLWTKDQKGQEEVRIRMGWLASPTSSNAILPDLLHFRSEIQKAGYTHILLLGMGGSSLAPEVMSLIFEQESEMHLTILDSTDPAQVLAAARDNPVASTLYIVSSKSGSTAEINAFFNYFWERAQHSVGNKAGKHFIAITDPGTTLEKLAHEKKFRKVFLADPNIGGRYSALTAFGLVPAALIGVDVERLLECSFWMARLCAAEVPAKRNPGFVLGAILGEAALAGRDKLTVIADPEVAAFGSWLEQLIAESSGKLGKGILPVNGEPLAAPNLYGNDRLFVYFWRSGKYDRAVNRLRKAGHPIIRVDLSDNYGLGAEFYRWEVATAVACSILGVNAFDQPDVQDSKSRTIAKITYYQKHAGFDEKKPAWEGSGVNIYGKIPSGIRSLTKIVDNFLGQGKTGDYVAINAYIRRDRRNETILQKLRTEIRTKTRLATTVGFGPRYLHSTGQLHKGGADNGLFLVITSAPKIDADIPGQGISFGALEHGQALGDIEALQVRGRRVLHIHFTNPELVKTLV